MECYSFAFTCLRFDILKHISVIVKVDISWWRTTWGYKVTIVKSFISRLRIIWSMKCFMICVDHQVEWNLKLQSEDSLLRHLKMCNVYSTFFSNRLKIQLHLRERFYDGKQSLHPPTYLQPAGCRADHTSRWEYQYSILEKTNKELCAASATRKLTINRVSSFNFS